MRAGEKKIPWPRPDARLLRLLHPFHEFGHLWTLLDTPCPNLTLAVRVSFSRPTYIFGHFGYFCVYFCKEEEETVFMKMFLGKEVRPPRNGSEVSKI